MDSPVPVRPAGNGPEGETGTTVRYQKTGGFLKPEGALIPPPKDAVQHRMGVEVHSALYPTAPVSLTKTAMFLSSGDPEMYEGAKFSFEGDFLGYLGLENMGMFTCAGDVKESVLEEIRKMAASL